MAKSLVLKITVDNQGNAVLVNLEEQMEEQLIKPKHGGD